MDFERIEELRLIVVVAFVAATVGVWAGVWLEGDRFSAVVHKIGWRVLVWSLGAETLLTILIFAADAEISERQRAEIRAQNIELIALRKNSLPRSIDVSAFAKQLAGAPPVKIEIRYVVACADCEALAFWLSEAIKKAAWPVDPPIPVNPLDRDWPRAISFLHAQTSGITTVVDSPDKITADPKTPLGAMNWALTQALGFNFNIQGGIDVRMSPDVIRVVIAPKA